ncbi:MAG: hypothetical protein BWX70_02029 [Verrucomicrobia bacterium ADurb.Bin070]|nr:MAG: hypothetical protein BWX70_02029 [Verrucomicrobia bacterium ADurb.Bin070]
MRCWSSAWEETSITAVSQPAPRIAASSPCSSQASGVVRVAGIVRPPYSTCTVDSRPGVRPPARNSSRSSQAVVVLPFVPVMPVTRSARAGQPFSAAARQANAPRASLTAIVCLGASRTGVCANTATAPLASAAAA